MVHGGHLDYIIVIMADPREILKHRRGVAKASITRIETRLSTLGGESESPGNQDATRQMLSKLKEHD